MRIYFLTVLILLCWSYDDYAQSAQQRQQHGPSNYKSRIDMYDDISTYFILPNDEVMQSDGNGGFVLVGYKEPTPKGRSELLFIFTILQTAITYGVDRYGHVWRDYGDYREIVGNANRAGLIEQMK